MNELIKGLEDFLNPGEVIILEPATPVGPGDVYYPMYGVKPRPVEQY